MKILYLDDIPVLLKRKNVKNINLSIHPPNGEVRITSPLLATEKSVMKFAYSRLDWIIKHRQKYATNEPLQELRMISGEVHYYRGKAYTLKLIEGAAQSGIEIAGKNMYMYCRGESDYERRKRLLYSWYRTDLAARIDVLKPKWKHLIKLEPESVSFRKMKARWGSCSISSRHIRLNTELAKLSDACLEYVYVHELVHLLERAHNRRFYSYMDSFLPGWRKTRAILNGRKTV